MAISGKHIFISGGAGFIGAALISRLIENNKITVYDNFSRNSLKDWRLENHPNLTLVKGDVLDADSIARNMAGANIVVHLAAIAGIDTVIGVADPAKGVALMFNTTRSPKSPQETVRLRNEATNRVLGAVAEV